MMTLESSETGQHRHNPGETLRQAREARDWSLAEVATQLNLTSKRLEQLEGGEFDKLPGHTFARGYLRAYAKLLGLDQGPIVADFDRYTGTDAAGASVHALSRIEEPMRLSQGILRTLSFVLLLVLAIVGFVWWQERTTQVSGDVDGGLSHIEVESADGTTQIHPLSEPEDDAVAQGQSAEAPPAPLSPELAAEPEAAAPPTVEPLVAPSVTSEAVAPQPVPAPVAPVVSTPAPAAPAVETPVSVTVGEGLVEIQFSELCWVQVADANKKVLHSSIKRKGESLRVVGKAPLELRLGVARAAQVSYNGAPVELAPFTSGETARLTLGQ
jgi:cytoskeleton protein RodZ